MKSSEIIDFARRIKRDWHTNDPYVIAEKCGIVVLHRRTVVPGFTAQTVKMAGYPTIISINDSYSDFSKKLLCAHELGHALLHENTINHFAVTNSNAGTDVELEANLFAVALLCDNDIDRRLCMPLSKMNNYLLKSFVEYNLD